MAMTLFYPTITRAAAAALLCLALQGGAMAQMSGADLAVRLQQLEGQMRALNGRIEQLEFQNRRLDDQLKRFQGDIDFRFQEIQGGGGAAANRPAQRPAAPQKPRTDVIEPGPAGQQSAANSSSGAAAPPQVLGQIPAGQRDAGAGADVEPEASDPGAPLVISPPGTVPPRGEAPARADGPRNTVIASAPSNNPRDEFDLGVGFVQRRDYELAEMSFRKFLEDHPNDRLAAEAQYWLGESLYQRRQYRDAAEVFLKVTTESTGSAKAPESMLRLGMSLSGLGERDAACATYAEITKKYPRASAGVRSQIDRETKRVRC
jgi:tol-pal system protein YbgF